MKFDNIELLREDIYRKYLQLIQKIRQFLNRLKPLEAKLPILFHDNGKKWLSDLFEVSKGFVREEYESRTQSAVDIAGACA